MLATELIEEVRDNGDITPDTDDTTILRAADAEIRTRLLPMLRTINEEYLVRWLDIASVNGRVPLPPRATGAAVRMVQVVLGAGQLSDPLPRVDPAIDRGTGSGGQPFGFYFDGGSICLVPSSSSATVRVRYYARPGKLLTPSVMAGQVITFVTPGDPTTAITSLYAGFTNSVDIVSVGPSHIQKAIGVPLGGVSPFWTVPTASLFEMPIAGDALVQADQTIFVPLPEELSSTLALRTAAKVLFNLGYKEEARSQYDLAETAQAEAMAMLRPRSDGNPKQLSGGLLARMGGGSSWGRW